MKRFLLSFPLASLLLLSVLSQVGFAQTPSSSQAPVRDPKATVILQQSLAALVGNNSLTDVTLTGTGSRTAGSNSETGTATFRATSSGQVRIDLSLASGQRSEARDASVVPATGSWMGPDASIKPIPQHNLMTEPTWAFPAFIFSRVLSNMNYSISPVDQQARFGITVNHITVFQQVTVPGDASNLFQSLTRMELYLDASSLLPVAIEMNTHPDNNAALNIPVEFEYSDYRATQSASVPFHVQQLVNNVVFLDIEISSVNFNTGLTNATFNLP
jgi:hypothetical protein